jgi:hypothetical protein
MKLTRDFTRVRVAMPMMPDAPVYDPETIPDVEPWHQPDFDPQEDPAPYQPSPQETPEADPFSPQLPDWMPMPEPKAKNRRLY